MATSKTLDPSTCTSASEAFKYPLPQVRQFHRQLTSELDEKNARLRTLVGGSYRQLLGTAETILQMRHDIVHVEEKLGRVGKGCGRGVVGSMATGLAKLQESGKGGRKNGELEWCARMKVLDMCAVTVGRLMRKGGSTNLDPKEGKGKSLVLAAKVLVLGRLLLKGVEATVLQRSPQDKDSVDEIKKKLKLLRRRLEKAVDRTLEKIGDNRDDLIQALCAYSLATNYGAKDVLRHFLDVRGQAMTLCFDDESEQKDEATGVVRALELYTKTLLDVQALVPRRLSEALAILKSKPLLKDQSVREQEGLRLDVCEKWFGDEILFFMPYIRHDDLDGPNAVSMLRKWAKEASDVMLQGFAKTLDQMAEFKAVVELRTRVLEIWIKEGGKAKGFDASILLDGFRKVINERLVELLESRVSKLRLVSSGVEARLGSWQAGISDAQESLWDPSMLEMEISNGASSFKQAIISRTYGRNDAVSNIYQSYQTWRQLIEEIITVISQLKKQKWDDDLEDIEDDLSLESRNTLLSTDDPQMLQEHLDSGLESAYKELHEKLGHLLTTYQESPQIGAISVYLLRIIRDIRSELPRNHSSLKQFGLTLIPTLHQQLAFTVTLTPFSTFTKALVKNSRSKKVPGKALWEGTPLLPVQPSPNTFKLLHSLSIAMANTGSDLWSPAAVRVLKGYLSEKIVSQWQNTLMEEKTEHVNGTGETQPASAIETDGNNNNNSEEAQESSSPDTSSPTPKATDSTEPQNSTNNSSTDSNNNNNTKPPDDEETIKDITTSHKDYFTQSLFDIYFLKNALEIPELTADKDKLGWEDLETALLSRGGATMNGDEQIGDGEQKRLRASAREFWRRSGLLFGFLG